MTSLTIQIHRGGRWHDAAAVNVKEPALGLASPCTVDYDTDYYLDNAALDVADGRTVTDDRALSVGIPVDLAMTTFPDGWPPFLLDLLPQGSAKRRLAARLGITDPDDPAVAVPLLLAGAGSPIGNLRIREARRREEETIAGEVTTLGPCPGVTLTAMLERTDVFVDVAERYALAASGSSGVQGEWPKILMTQADDELWYPDSLVPDERARAHAIVKMSRARAREDALILESEAPYLEVARDFGLRVGRPLVYGRHALIIPRFDRRVGPDGVIRVGQESIVSALGIAEFGHVGTHEAYLSVIAEHCTDPLADAVEYVLRDLLNVAMGNPDNHGRNTALAKTPDGRIALTPLFDFAPMRLDPGVIMRSTKWACMKGRDADPDWAVICAAAAQAVGAEPSVFVDAVAEKADALRQLPEIARDRGVPDETIRLALVRHAEMADRVGPLKERPHAR
jgi:serine/threonine-protein kinase HipA